MKYLFAITVLFLGSQAFAWNKIIECNDGELVIDKGEKDIFGREVFQLVLRREALSYFIQAGAVESRRTNDKGEFILNLSVYDGNFLGFLGMRTDVQRMYWIVRENSNDFTLRAENGGRPGTGEEIANWKFYNCNQF